MNDYIEHFPLTEKDVYSNYGNILKATGRFVVNSLDTRRKFCYN